VSRGIWEGRGIRFTGFGHYYPRTVERIPADLPPPSPVEEAVLGAELGVRARHVSDGEETIAYMAARACEAALREADADPADLDLLVLSTWTQRRYVPEDGTRTARLLGATSALAIELCGACVGFVHAVQTAASLLTTNGWRRAAVVCSDQFSKRLLPGGRGQMIAGDAAGAAVLEVGDPAAPGLRDSVVLSYGEDADVAVVHPRSGWGRSRPRISKVAPASAAEAVDIVLDRCGLTVKDVDWIVPHPGSARISANLADRLGVPEDALLTNYADRGQTTSATIPTTLSEYRAKGVLKSGDLVLAPAAGAGWFSGALVFDL